MKVPSVRLLAIACSLGLMTLGLACGSKSSPAAPTPTPPAPVVVTVKLETPALASPIGGTGTESLKPTLSVNNAGVTGAVGTVTYEFEVSELDTFPAGSRTSSEKGIAEGSGETKWTPPSNLIPNFKYYWHARATNGTITTEWSKTETFITQNKGFIDGFTIYDPLTDGSTVGRRFYGQGRFIFGTNSNGWQSTSLNDGIQYDIPTCNDCTVEFDATNFGAGEGGSIQVDVKWFSMGDRNAWTGFSPFRDHPWKMHLEQRSDGDGTGMQVIWRNGAADADTGGDPEYGDHRGKYANGGPNWGRSSENKVWHFKIKWTPTTYEIFVNELGKAEQRWFPGAGDSGRFGGNHSYSPPNMRIELGCVPRGESMVGVIYRNFRLSRN